MYLGGQTPKHTSDVMKTILITYPFFKASDQNIDEISGTDKRNLWCFLFKEKLESIGYRVICSDDRQFIETLDVRCEISLNAATRYTLAPHVALFMETPAIAPENNIENASKYDRVISFDPDILKLENAIKSNLPCWSPTIFSGHTSNKSGYTMIAANKFLNSQKYSKDLYSERRKIISWFEKNNRGDFSLYGKNWNKPAALLGRKKLTNALKNFGLKGQLKNYRGEIASKYQQLQKYTFNFCYENCHYPGYVTEKIFDAFVTKCIPIYWPSEQAKAVLDKASYIDASKFSSVRDLTSFCDSLGVSAKSDIVEAGQQFLNSSGHKFTHENYAEIVFSNVLGLINVQNHV